jgi:hypothetical protein
VGSHLAGVFVAPIGDVVALEQQAATSARRNLKLAG